MSEEKEYDIKSSVKQVGALYPVIVDKKGRIIDGFHRLAEFPEWPKYALTTIDTDEKYLLAKIFANWHRRKLDDKEKTELLDALAEKQGWTPQEIADKTGIPYRTVTRYISDEYKNQEMQELAQKSHKKRQVPAATLTATTKAEPKHEIKITYDPLKPADPAEQYVLDIDLWFLPPSDPVTQALYNYCKKEEVHWKQAVRQFLGECLREAGYLDLRRKVQ